MNINVTDEQMKSIIATSLLQVMSTEKKDEMMKAALVALISPVKQGYGREETSPLQDTFNRVVQSMVGDITREFFETNADAKEKLRAIIVAGYEKFLSADREGLVNIIAGNFSAHLAKQLKDLDRY